MNKDDLQTLIDLPSGDGIYRFSHGNNRFVCDTDDLIALATELRDRREFDEWEIWEPYFFEPHENGVALIEDGIGQIGYGKRAFEAWQNAKREGKL